MKRYSLVMQVFSIDRPKSSEDKRDYNHSKDLIGAKIELNVFLNFTFVRASKTTSVELQTEHLGVAQAWQQ